MKTQLSKNIIRFRKQKGLSQAKLADRSGLTQRTIAYYETEIDESPINNIVAIAKALNVSLDTLFGYTEPKKNETEIEKMDTRSLEKIKTILSLPKKERHIIYSIAESFIAKRKMEELNKKE